MAPTNQVKLDFPLRRLRSSSSKENGQKQRTSSLPNPVQVSSLLQRSKKHSVVTKSPVKTVKCTTPKKAGRTTASPLKALDNSSPKKSPRVVLSQITDLQAIRTVSSAPATPQIKARKQLFRRDTSRYQDAKTALSTAVPDTMIGRTEQIKVIKQFLARKESKRRSLYISGAPGTGKTASLKYLLKSQVTKKKLCEIFINCMSLKQTKDVFPRIAKQLDPSYDGQNAQKFIEDKICSHGPDVLLILDEVDQLDSKGQEVLYTIFEWPYIAKSRLILVGIANALDLTDRVLPRLKLSDAISPIQLSFPSYTRDEINTIILTRLKEANSSADAQEPIIKPVAIKFLAGKISALSGDIRKALDVCRRAIDLADLEYRKQTILTQSKDETVIKQIDLPQILKIFNEVYSSRVSASLKSANSDLPLQQKLLLATLLLMTAKVSKQKEVTVGKLHETHSRVCRKRGLATLDLSEAASLCSLLEARGLLGLRKAGSKLSGVSAARESRVSLRIDEKEVEDALQDKALLASILGDLECVNK